MAAAAAIEGRFVDIRDWDPPNREGRSRPINRPGSRVLTARRRRHRPDHPKQFLKRVERTGFGEFLFYDWAQEPGWDLPVNPFARRRAQLRVRLEPRARAVGPPRGLRLPGDSRARASPTSSARTCTKIGLLAVELHASDCAAIADAGRGAGSTLALRRCAGREEVPDSRSDPEIKHRLLNGLDEHRADARSGDAIASYEQERERPGPVTTAL